MLRFKLIVVTALIAAFQMAAPVEDAQAGPLLDWLRGLRNQNVNRPRLFNNNGCFSRNAAATQPTTAYSNPYGLQPGQCQRTCMKQCSRTVVNYVPYTAYRTTYEKVPVTQYRPVTNSDPCTGCTVTCMKPCTTYTYQMKRVPYTTYRPCYRTETYRVPVTTITNDCNTGCNTCSTGVANNCATCNTSPMSAAQQTIAPQGTNGSYYTYPNGTAVPQGTLNTNGGFSEVPAEQVPTLNVTPTSSHRSIIDRMNVTKQTTWPRQSEPRPVERTETQTERAPAYINFDDKTAQSTVRQRWSYSPVRLASYSAPVEVEAAKSYSGQAKIRPATKAAVNEGWESVEW